LSELRNEEEEKKNVLIRVMVMKFFRHLLC